MILQNEIHGNESDISNGSYIYLKDGDYEAYVDWTELTPVTRSALLEIASQTEELRLKSVELVKGEFPESCTVLDLDLEPAVSGVEVAAVG